MDWNCEKYAISFIFHYSKSRIVQFNAAFLIKNTPPQYLSAFLAFFEGLKKNNVKY